MSFRLYLISGISRRFEPAQEFVAASEEEAIAIAEEARSGRAAELWLGSRMVKEWSS